MEDWISPAPPHTAEMCAMVRKHTLNSFCAMLSQQAGEPASVLAELYCFVACLWHGMRDEEPLVRPLVKLFYDLEFGVSEGGQRLKPMVHGMTPAEHARRLALLDAGKERFKRHLLEGLPGLPGIGVRNLVIRWARFQYDEVHHFQAPYRADPQQAMRDSMGLSDHFAELMEEVIDVIDPGAERGP